MGRLIDKPIREVIAELKRIAEHQSFDEIPMPQYSLEHIDFEAVRERFSDIRKLSKKDLETLKIVEFYQEKLVPTVGGILLYGKNREKRFSDAYIQCARFRGKEKVEIVDQLEIHQHLPDAADRAVEFVQKHVLLEGEIDSLYRKDIWSVPMDAIREGVVNAIIHADYSLTGMPIRIAIFSNRIEIINPGLFMNGITVADINEGVSKIRNRVIARNFKELGLVEHWGTGFGKIQLSCKEYMLPSPIIKEVGGPCVSLIIFTESDRFAQKITESLREVLDAIKGTKGLATQEIASVLDVTPRTIRTRVNQLTKLGFLVSIASSSNDPQGKYILTQKGENELK